MSSKGASRKCSFTRADGRQCRAWAVRGSEPPRCAAHREDGPAVGAPVGNKNREIHGAYAEPDLGPEPSLAEVIADLKRTLQRVRLAISECTDPKDLMAWADLQGRLSSRIGRLERDQAALGGGQDDFWSVLDQVLDEVGDELGLEL
jgi:hypothetical protein